MIPAQSSVELTGGGTLPAVLTSDSDVYLHKRSK